MQMRVDVSLLKKIVSNPRVVRALAEAFAGPYAGSVVRAEVGMYEHGNGVLVDGRPGRWWVYIRLLDGKGEPIYDVALWKALAHPSVARFFQPAVKIVAPEAEAEEA